jgi:hypothetical protein
MQTDGKQYGGDAFDRALRETFGEASTFAKVEEARRLYARYRTEDVLRGCRNIAPDENGDPQPWT